jgi:glycerol-3-phosphate O-acyltransferase
LTKDGRLREPRFGVLDYMLRGFRSDSGRDLVFVPVGLNYDRVLEDRTQLLGAADAPPAPPRSGAGAALQTLGFIGSQGWLMLRSRWHRFGYACVNFGAPVSVRAWQRDHGVQFETLGKAERQAAVADFGRALMGQVAALIPVLPVPLVCSVLLQGGRPMSEFEIKAAAGALIEKLQAGGARLYLPRSDLDYAIGAGLRMLRQRHLVEEGADGLYAAVAGERRLLSYYANSIAHLIG